MKDKTAKDEPITIKKYANRRLYNTATSSYVTLDHLCDMVKDNVEFVVYDAKTGEDITRSVLTQIIFEEENKGQSMMPIRFLRQLIRFYGDSLQSFVPSYLEVSMETFARNQEDMRKRITDAWGGAQSQALKDWEGQARQNMALFQQAFRMFTPFMPNLTRDQAEAKAAEAAPSDGSEARELAELRRQLQTMQRQIDTLTQKTPEKAETK
ncbi:MAG TPA: polyhydroxyalkanoate synthesis repressor PhaR [Alphaproteobacteria bacterium]|nr:polyhydroxyalkanoate synthesis repressor PhaR [Alphaproteobacteria bacterium]